MQPRQTGRNTDTTLRDRGRPGLDPGLRLNNPANFEHLNSCHNVMLQGLDNQMQKQRAGGREEGGLTFVHLCSLETEVPPEVNHGQRAARNVRHV